MSPVIHAGRLELAEHTTDAVAKLEHYNTQTEYAFLPGTV